MTEMIKRLADAMQRETVNKPFSWENAARAALAELRTPTREMLAAADSAIPLFEEDERGIRVAGTDGALAAWEAMIAVAFGERQSGSAYKPSDEDEISLR